MVSRKGALKVFRMVGIIGEAHVDSHGELCLCRIALSTYRLVALLVLRDFTLYLQVAVTLNLCQTGVGHEMVSQLVVEQRPHRSPYIVGADREFSYLDGLGLAVIDAGSVELVAHGTGRQQHEGCQTCRCQYLTSPVHIVLVYDIGCGR